MFRESNKQVEREINFQFLRHIDSPTQGAAPHSCPSAHGSRTSVMESGKSQQVVKNPIRGQSRRSLRCSLVVLLQSLIIIQNVCQQTASAASSSASFKTSFVSSGDYASIRRNGALLSMPNVEQIQRDQVDSIISPPAFDPTAEDENFAILNRELNFLLRDEHHQAAANGKQPDDGKQHQISSEPTQTGDNGRRQANFLMQTLEDLVASPSAQTNTGQVEPASNNGTSATIVVDSTSSKTSSEAKQEPAQQVQYTTLPPAASTSSTQPPIYTTTSQSVSSSAPSSTTAASITTTTVATTTTEALTSVAPNVIPNTPTSVAEKSATNDTQEANNSQDAVSNTTTITIQPVELATTTAVALSKITDEKIASTTVATMREPSSSQAPETTTTTPTSSQSASTSAAAASTVDNKSDSVVHEAKTIPGDGSNATNSSSAAASNPKQSDVEQQVNATTVATGSREARGREKVICHHGEPNCSYVVATVPVVDKWKLATGTNNNPTNPTRVVDEFVFIPAGDSSLSFEDAGYSTRRPGVKDSEMATMKAEHRTIDGEGDFGEGSASVVGTAGSNTEVDDVELDYVTSDIEPLSGKSAVQAYPSSSAISNSNASGQQEGNNRQFVLAQTTTEAAISSTARQPVSFTRNITTTTIKPSLESVSSTRISTTNTKSSPMSSSPAPATKTTTAEPAARVSTSQSTSFSIRSSGPASSNGQTTIKLSGHKPPSDHTTSSTTPVPAMITTTTRRIKAARPNQKLMRIGEQTTSIKVEATALAAASAAASSTAAPAKTITTTTSAPSSTTSARPSSFDWRRGETSGNRRPKTSSLASSRVSQHRQYFSEPAGDLRRRPVGQAASQPSVESDEEEAAKILTRYTISSQLSRLSAAGVPAQDRIRSTAKTIPDQRRSTARSAVSSGGQKRDGDLRRVEQQGNSQMLRQAPSAGEWMPTGTTLQPKSSTLVSERRNSASGGQRHQSDLRQNSSVAQQEQISTTRAADATAFREFPLAQSVAARSATKQELAISLQSQSSGGSASVEPFQLNIPVSSKQSAPVVAADLHSRVTGNNDSGGANTSSVADNEEQIASRQSLLSSMRDPSDTLSVGSYTVANGSSVGHTSGSGTGNRLPVQTTTTSSSIFRSDTPTTTSKMEPMTTTTMMTSQRPATTKSDSTMTTTTTTMAPIAAKRELDPQVVGQARDELLALIAQSLPSTSFAGDQSAKSSNLLAQPDRRQVRAEPRFLEVVVPTTSTAATPLFIRPKVDSTTSKPAAARKQPAVFSNKRDGSATMAPPKNDRHKQLVDELDEYVGSIEDQLAKDALHYHSSAHHSGSHSSNGARKTNSYTLKLRHGLSAAGVDTGKWQPSSDESASVASEESGQVGSGEPLPGRPGVDYPIHWQVPKTSFDCRNYEQSGFYADVESDCQAYHSCHKGRGGRHTFLCPNGTLFSQELLTCDWWYNVECSASKLYLTNEGTIFNSLDIRAQFGDTNNNRATTNELSV